MNSVVARVDIKGRLVIPKKVREELGIKEFVHAVWIICLEDVHQFSHILADDVRNELPRFLNVYPSVVLWIGDECI